MIGGKLAAMPLLGRKTEGSWVFQEPVYCEVDLWQERQDLNPRPAVLEIRVGANVL